MAGHFLVPGQRAARGQVVELAHELRHPDQIRLTGHAGPRRGVRLPRHVAVDEAHDLPALRIEAEEPGAPSQPARSKKPSSSWTNPARIPGRRCTVSPIRTTPLTARPAASTHASKINSGEPELKHPSARDL